jgi:hypothetical protein
MARTGLLSVTGEESIMAARVTAADVRELLTSTSMDPTLVEWLSEDNAITDTVEVISGALFTDISWNRYNARFRVIATANDLRQIGDWDVEHPTNEDFEAFAQMLNESD